MTAPVLVSDIVAHWSARAPGRIALAEKGRACTYAQLDAMVQRTARWLVDAEVRAGDRVMLVCENSIAGVAVYLACTALGAWPVIVNARLSDREIAEIREHSGARRTVYTVDASAHARAHAEKSGATFADPASFGTIGLSPLNVDCAVEPAADTAEHNVAALIYTSGTTGQPKGVMLTHANLMFVARESGRARALTADDRVYAVLPMSHILGLTGVLLGSLLYGASVHLIARFDPVAAMAALRNDGISVLIGTPSMYGMLSEYAQRKGLAPVTAPALRLMSSAGAPLDLATKHSAEAAFGHTLHNGYGITECAPSVMLTPLDAPRADCGVGILLPGIEAKLVGENGNEAPQGENGELFIRSPGVMKGYYKAAAETEAVVDADGWFRTGDLARLADGSFFITGRAKEMIIRFGFNVYPAEIEGVLNAHPAVARAAVIGRRKDGDEEILAFIEPTPGSVASDAELSEYAAARLAPYKRPSRFFLVPDMPLTPAGKILKSKLAAGV